MHESAELPASRRIAPPFLGPAWPAAAALALVVLVALLARPDLLGVAWQEGRWRGMPIDVLQRAVPVVLLALGTAAVIGTGGVDLSVGTIMVLAGSAAAVLLRSPALHPLVVLLLALALGALLGLWNGVLVAGLRIAPIVATLVLYTLGRGLAMVWTGSQIVPIESEGFASLAHATLAGLPLPIWIAAGAAAVLGALLRGTVLGLSVEALGDNERAAYLAGIPTRLVLCVAYAIAGLYAALAGSIACADLRSTDPANLGQFLELDAILAVVLGGGRLGGGRTSLTGAVLGALLLQSLTSALVAAGVGYEGALAVKAAAVLLVSAARSPRLRRLRLVRARGVA
jgi:simple sugar transport system permease protein